MNLFKERAALFLNGRLYPILLLFSALISHALSMELFGITVFILTGSIGFFVCDDLKFVMAPLIMFVLMFSQESISAGTYYTTGYVVAMIIALIYITAVIVAHFVIHKKSVDFNGFYKSHLFWGIVLLCGAFLLNGLFCSGEYVVQNLIFAFAMIVSIGLIFFLLSSNLKSNDNLMEYVFYVLFIVSALVILEFYFSFFGQIQIVDGSIVKESILLGWGIWNNVGGILAFLLPAHFYLALTVKRYGYLFYLSGAITYLTIALTLSRSSLLVATPIFIICAVLSCVKGENKKICRFITAFGVILCLAGAIAFWDKLYSLFADFFSRGFDDNGRFEIYKKGIDNFLDNPIFGGGFFSADAQDFQFVAFMPDRYHNTPIQLLGTCGIVGLLSYAFHRYQTVRILVKKKGLESIFCALCLGGLLLTSLLDNHFFNIYPGFIYITLLVAMEKASIK